jgi:hypothetical protein
MLSARWCLLIFPPNGPVVTTAPFTRLCGHLPSPAAGFGGILLTQAGGDIGSALSHGADNALIPQQRDRPA